MPGGRPVVGLAPKGTGATGRAVVGLAPTKGTTGRTVVGLPGSQPKSSGGGGGFLHGLEKYSGAELVGNLAKDVGQTAVGIGPGLYHVAKDVGEAAVGTATRNKGMANRGFGGLETTGKGLVQQYKDYYGHDLAHHLYTHPLQPILDAATLASGGAGAAAKVGKVAADVGAISPEARLAQLGKRATIKTRSPRQIATGKGPSHTEITSTKPLVKGREVAVAKVRAARPEGVRGFGGELKRYGKQIQSEATQHALERMTPLEAYHKATHRLSQNEWTALHIRAMDIHPTDLQQLWKGTPLEKTISDPKVTRLVESPSKRMQAAEPQARALSAEGAKLFQQKGLLKEETAVARPELTKQQASETLGRPVKQITGKPYYFPHTLEPPKNVSPLIAGGGGKAVPRKLGSTKQNLGVLALRGKLHLRSDVLGPEFLRRIKYVKYDEVHNALVRGAVRLSHQQIEQQYGGKLPKGWEYVREKASTRIPPTLRGEGETPLGQVQPLEKTIPNPEDLHDSVLAKEGFTTQESAQAHTSGGHYYIVPKSTARAATGEFTRSSNFTHAFIRRPLMVWRAAVLGLRAGFLTNNLVGNSVMYAARTGGQGALRDLFMAIRETHGAQVAKQVLDDAATPPPLRADLYKEFFPEQIQGTFGRTQSPATSLAHVAGRKSLEVARGVTGAIPRLTSKVAEEYPRRALIRNFVRHSPEFKQAYKALPRQTRTFEQAARTVLEGKGGTQYQRFISKQVNQALGDYLHLSPFERNVMRNTLPFYSWYRAITQTTYHLAADTPLRANALRMIGQISKPIPNVPSFLQGAIPLGPGAQGTQKVLTTQGMNPYATLEQVGRGVGQDYTQLGLNPFVEGPLQYMQRHTGNVSPLNFALSPLKDLALNLPPSRLLFPPGPSHLYPTRRGIKGQLPSFVGVPVKEYDPAVAAAQAAAGR